MFSSIDPRQQARQTQERAADRRIQDDDGVDLSTPPPKATSPKTRIANISELSIKQTFKALGRLITADDDDRLIRRFLVHFWLLVTELRRIRNWRDIWLIRVNLLIMSRAKESKNLLTH